MRTGKLGFERSKDPLPVERGQWGRRVVSALVLCASVAALALLLVEQGSKGRFGPTEAGAFQTAPVLVGGDRERQAVTDSALMHAEEARYRALSEFVAKRYYVSQEAAFDLVTVAHRAGRQLQLDPLLIIAVIAIESRFNPIAESPAGAKGLMQIIPKYHGDKLEAFGGEQAVFEPAANIHVGAWILKEYLRRTGNLGIALQMYAGALNDREDQYTRKVMSEHYRLQQVVAPSRPRPTPVPVATRTATAPAAASQSFTLPSALD